MHTGGRIFQQIVSYALTVNTNTEIRTLTSMPHKVEKIYDMQTEFPALNITGKYFSERYHRHGNPHLKSQWCIDIETEFELFAMAKVKKWISKDGRAWALLLDEKKPQVVGLTRRQEESKFARFEDGNHNDIWHGYPEEYTISKNDIPTLPILQEWVNAGYITNRVMTKIRLGQPCNL